MEFPIVLDDQAVGVIWVVTQFLHNEDRDIESLEIVKRENRFGIHQVKVIDGPINRQERTFLVLYSAGSFIVENDKRWSILREGTGFTFVSDPV